MESIVPHSDTREALLSALNSTAVGLSETEAEARLQSFGPNSLIAQKLAPIGLVFFRQFLNPLIYILIAAAVVSLLIGDSADAAFIIGVLLFNAGIGTAQEYGAQRSAAALSNIQTQMTRVQRDGEILEVDSASLVPGDVIWTTSGSKVPADIRLLSCQDLQVDESLLTGESEAVTKDATAILPTQVPLADRVNTMYSGTLVIRGRAQGVVVTTGSGTELGRIAKLATGKRTAKPPLLQRMERFTQTISIVMGVAVLILAAIGLLQNIPMQTVFLTAVALAVAAIPEGLPVALTVALAIGMRRMARRNVIVRRLVAVESLGSCTLIASDKTGTLTVNELTAREVVLASGTRVTFSGEGVDPTGSAHYPDPDLPHTTSHLTHLAEAAALCNEGFLDRRDGEWVAHGDAVDVALLVMARKQGVTRTELLSRHPQIGAVPYEPEQRYSASVHLIGGQPWAFVKGALETLLPMCSFMQGMEDKQAIDAPALEQQAQLLAGRGYRVLAVAAGPVTLADSHELNKDNLHELCLLGLVGLLDPPRPEAKVAIESCRGAGIRTIMITGDHPHTAAAIATQVGLIGPEHSEQSVITGAELHSAGDQLQELVQQHTVFARIEPQQKLEIVQALQAAGEYVAVTGDGANDAPALRAAHVGVAMGKRGTDIARETADMVVTDDNFASLVAGIEEGRVAYANVRKVVSLLLATGAAELVLVMLALAFALPLPLLPVQLLWLNLVTNGIQDVALAFEPGEGDELKRPPRAPQERIFNPLMIQRVLLSAVVIGTLSFGTFQWLLAHGYTLESARNLTLLLMVLFENVQVINSRSESRSAFLLNPLSNLLLLFGTLGAQLLHIAAMYTPGVRDVLHVEGISLLEWSALFGVAALQLLTVELHKLWRRRRA